MYSRRELTHARSCWRRCGRWCEHQSTRAVGRHSEVLAGLRPATEGTTMAKILLVEDNEMNRDMLTRRLQRRGHEVLVAVDGAQGLAVAQEQLPTLILMDMSLPVLDGWEATRQLKADPATSGIPVIALTAHAMSED